MGMGLTVKRQLIVATLMRMALCNLLCRHSQVSGRNLSADVQMNSQPMIEIEYLHWVLDNVFFIKQIDAPNKHVTYKIYAITMFS